MKKKKFLALLLTGAMALAALTGCSSGTETTEESTGGDASAESGDGAYKIALIQQHQTNAFQIGVTEGAQAKADELGVELNILSADQDAAKQISQIEQCVSEGYDAILFEPVDPDGLRDAAKAAADAGVIMINIVSACTDWESAGISAVSCGDNVKAGENEMQHVADLLGGKGNIAILTGPSSTTDTTARLEGYRNILANYPDMTEVIAPADCAWDTAKAQSTVESWLSAYDLDAIVCQNDGMAVGAGMYWLGLFESAVLVAIQVILHRFPVGADALTTQEILVEMEDTEDMQRRFDELLKKHGGQVTDSSLTREDGFLRMEITAKLEPPISHEEALAFMKENTGVRRMSV